MKPERNVLSILEFFKEELALELRKRCQGVFLIVVMRGFCLKGYTHSELNELFFTFGVTIDQ